MLPDAFGDDVEFRALLDPIGYAAGPSCPLCGRMLTAALVRRELPEGEDWEVPPERLDLVDAHRPRRLELEACGCRILLGGPTIPEVEVHKRTGYLRAVRLSTRQPDERTIYHVLHVDPEAEIAPALTAEAPA